MSYHSWSYQLDGALAGTPEMHKTQNFDPAEHALVPIPLDTWGGFLFLNFDQSAAPLTGYLGDLPERVAPYRLDDMACARRKEYVMECNWKLFVENAKESYHIATVHRQTINKYASARSSGYWVEEANGQHCITFAQHEGSMALLKGDGGFPLNESLAGRREAGGTTAPLIYPSTYLACTIACAWYLELHPLGPSRTRLIHGALFPKDRLSRNDFADVAENYYKRWDITIEEDIVASERQQRGLNSPFARPGRFSYREPLVHEIDNWILDRVLTRERNRRTRHARDAKPSCCSGSRATARCCSISFAASSAVPARTRPATRARRRSHPAASGCGTASISESSRRTR